jgi:hypothetical protein
LSDTAWSLKDLRSKVRARSLANDAFDAFVAELIRSIDRSTRIFVYHMTTARDAMQGFIDHERPQSRQNWELLLGVDTDRQADFEYAKIVSEANLVACAYTARSLLEVFAQLVNELVLSPPMPVADCTLKRLTERLQDGELKLELQRLVNSHWFAYVSAFVNTVKHRQLVQHVTSISFVENAAGIQVGAFSYNGEDYPPYWANAFLEGVISVKNSVISSGRALNRALALSDA